MEKKRVVVKNAGYLKRIGEVERKKIK